MPLSICRESFSNQVCRDPRTYPRLSDTLIHTRLIILLLIYIYVYSSTGAHHTPVPAAQDGGLHPSPQDGPQRPNPTDNRDEVLGPRQLHLSPEAKRRKTLDGQAEKVYKATGLVMGRKRKEVVTKEVVQLRAAAWIAAGFPAMC